jgi:hypothetical protein
MNRRASLALLAGLFAWAAAPAAEESHTIKRKELAAGEAAQVERTDTLKTTTLLVAKSAKSGDKGDTKFIDKTDTTAESYAYKETVLEREGGQPTKFERAYTKAQLTAGGPAADLPFKDKTVVIEKKGERYTFTYKGGKALSPVEAQFLELEFNRTAAERGEVARPTPPTGSVEVDKEWKLDAAEMLKPLEKGGELSFDTAKATGTGRLAKVYKKDDKTFGELRYTVKVPLRSFGQGTAKLNLKAGSSATFDVTQDVCIDGTADTGVLRTKTELSAKGTLPTPQGDGDLTLTILRETQETRKEVPKK